MYVRTVFLTATIIFGMSSAAFASGTSDLRPDAAHALAHPGSVTLYSLEPDRPPSGNSLDGFAVLGKAPLDATQTNRAITAFRAAMNHPMTMVGPGGSREVIVAACFDPRHAIRIASDGHTFDYLLCYVCGGVEVFRDGKIVSSLPAGGSPDALNELLKVKGLPISYSAR